MSQESRPSVPRWYWAICVVALLWNLMGCAVFATEMFAQEMMMESWTAEQIAWAESIPVWIYFVYGLAVFSGVGGSVGLMMRKTWAIALFGVCSVAVIVQMSYSMIIAGGFKVMGPKSAIMPLLVIAIAFALLWFSLYARKRSWLFRDAV